MFAAGGNLKRISSTPVDGSTLQPLHPVWSRTIYAAGMMAGTFAKRRGLRRWRSVATRIFVQAICACAAGFPLTAQGTRAIYGLVTDSAGLPISGARISIAGASLQATTGPDGAFTLQAAPVTMITIEAKRLGYSPARTNVEPGSAQRVRISMTALPTMLSPVMIRSEKGRFTGRLAGYYQRLQRKGQGKFITREQIDRKTFLSLSQLLKSIPGIAAYPLLSGGSAVRMRGNSCRPLVLIDGTPMPAAEVDLDAFPVSTLHGIELYSGGTTPPGDLIINSSANTCGTIALWSRGRDTDPPVPEPRRSYDLDRMVELLKVFPANQVDQPARPIDSAALAVAYPQDLLAANVSGSVTAEFVVDTAGGVESESFSIVSSTNEGFSVAVAASARKFRYTPALKEGRKVRQAVQQPFSFVTGPRKTTNNSK